MSDATWIHRYKAAVVILALMAPTALAAEPYQPEADETVLERVPLGSGEQRQTISNLRQTLEREPRNQSAAVALAKSYLTLYQQQGDARFLGYAEAAISPWLREEGKLPAPIQLLRAHLRQSRHDFESALADIEQVLGRNPRETQAWLMRATIATVQGDYAVARESCGRLLAGAEPLVTATCLANVNSLDAGPEAAYRMIVRALEADSGDDSVATAGTRLWARTLAGEIAARLGRDAPAESHYEAALETTTPDIYLLASYADFLLARDRYRDVLDLLEDRPAADAVLLRQALAASALDLTRSERIARRLERRFEASRRRGDEVHRREEARFALELAGEPERALTLAEKNWTEQREPADARLLLKAALASGRPEAADPVLQWLAAHPVDERLLELADEIGEPKS